jgi:SAM-dependent methyltransferase
MDLAPPADIVGDIREWRSLGLEPASFDAIVALEVVEHVDCFQECWDLLRPGGLLLLTTPVPEMDWACKLLEALGLNQRRTSPHDHLIHFDDIPLFQPVETSVKGFIAQWGVFAKPPQGAAEVSPG